VRLDDAVVGRRTKRDLRLILTPEQYRADVLDVPDEWIPYIFVNIARFGPQYDVLLNVLRQLDDDRSELSKELIVYEGESYAGLSSKGPFELEYERNALHQKISDFAAGEGYSNVRYLFAPELAYETLISPNSLLIHGSPNLKKRIMAALTALQIRHLITDEPLGFKLQHYNDNIRFVVKHGVVGHPDDPLTGLRTHPEPIPSEEDFLQ